MIARRTRMSLTKHNGDGARLVPRNESGVFRGSATLNQYMVTLCLVFVHSTMRAIVSAIGYPGSSASLESPILFYIVTAVLASVGGLLYHMFGQSRMITLACFIYVFGCASYTVMFPVSQMSDLYANLLLAVADVFFTIPTLALCITYVIPRRRLWFCSVFWVTSALPYIITPSLILALPFGKSWSSESFLKHGLSQSWEASLLSVSPVYHDVVRYVGINGLTFIGVSALMFIKRPETVVRSDGVTIVWSTWAGLVEEIFRCWTIPRETPGLGWFLIFYIRLCFDNVYEASLGEALHHHASIETNFIEARRAFAYLLGGSVGALLLPSALTPAVIAEVYRDGSSLVMSCWHRMTRRQATVPHDRDHDFRFQRSDAYLAPPSMVRRPSTNQSLIPVATSGDQDHPYVNPYVNKPQTAASATRLETGSLLRHSVVAPHVADVECPDAVRCRRTKQSNEPTFARSALFINIHIYVLTLIAHASYLVMAFGISDGRKRFFPSMSYVYAGLLGAADATAFVYGVWVLGYFSENNIVLSAYYVGCFSLCRALGALMGWIVRQLVSRVFFPNGSDISVVLLFMRWFFESVAFLAVLRGLRTVRYDLTPSLPLCDEGEENQHHHHYHLDDDNDDHRSVGPPSPSTSAPAVHAVTPSQLELPPRRVTRTNIQAERYTTTELLQVQRLMLVPGHHPSHHSSSSVHPAQSSSSSSSGNHGVYERLIPTTSAVVLKGHIVCVGDGKTVRALARRSAAVPQVAAPPGTWTQENGRPVKDLLCASHVYNNTFFLLPTHEF